MTHLMTRGGKVSAHFVLAVLLLFPACAGVQAADTQPPSAELFQRLVSEAHAKFKDLKEGKNADYIPYLAKVDSNLFGVAIPQPSPRKLLPHLMTAVIPNPQEAKSIFFSFFQGFEQLFRHKARWLKNPMYFRKISSLLLSLEGRSDP